MIPNLPHPPNFDQPPPRDWPDSFASRDEPGSNVWGCLGTLIVVGGATACAKYGELIPFLVAFVALPTAVAVWAGVWIGIGSDNVPWPGRMAIGWSPLAICYLLSLGDMSWLGIGVFYWAISVIAAGTIVAWRCCGWAFRSAGDSQDDPQQQSNGLRFSLRDVMLFTVVVAILASPAKSLFQNGSQLGIGEWASPVLVIAFFGIVHTSAAAHAILGSPTVRWRWLIAALALDAGFYGFIADSMQSDWWQTGVIYFAVVVSHLTLCWWMLCSLSSDHLVWRRARRKLILKD